MGAIAYDQAGAWGPVLAIVVDPDGDLFAAAAAAVCEMWGQMFVERGWS